MGVAMTRGVRIDEHPAHGIANASLGLSGLMPAMIVSAVPGRVTLFSRALRPVAGTATSGMRCLVGRHRIRLSAGGLICIPYGGI
jgi:hypothetical protein